MVFIPQVGKFDLIGLSESAVSIVPPVVTSWSLGSSDSIELYFRRFDGRLRCVHAPPSVVLHHSVTCRVIAHYTNGVWQRSLGLTAVLGGEGDGFLRGRVLEPFRQRQDVFWLRVVFQESLWRLSVTAHLPSLKLHASAIFELRG